MNFKPPHKTYYVIIEVNGIKKEYEFSQNSLMKTLNIKNYAILAGVYNFFLDGHKINNEQELKIYLEEEDE